MPQDLSPQALLRMIADYLTEKGLPVYDQGIVMEDPDILVAGRLNIQIFLWQGDMVVSWVLYDDQMETVGEGELDLKQA